MPQSHDKTSDPVAELPNPELNPLLNPTLGRNLGRWAQVYFTSPPEKREEAVGELLRELRGQSEPDELPVGVTEPPTQVTHNFPNGVSQKTETGFRCTECGHQYSDAQRFCGMCGAPLIISQTEEAVEIRRIHEVAPPTFMQLQEPSTTGNSNPVIADDVSDIRWLRDKRLTEKSRSWRPGPQYTSAFIAIFAIGVLMYAQWRPQTVRPQAGPEQNTKSAPTADTRKAPSPPPQADRPSADAPHSTSTRPGETNKQLEPATAPQAARTIPPVQHNPEPQQPETPSVEQAHMLPASGAEELAQAELYLDGKKHPRDSAEAAKYLWRAVGKENPTAILLLSDMYQVGDGVPKSCDQARLLLTAAARKGIPQAADKLRDLLKSGCR